jgi:hypothetical protein
MEGRRAQSKRLKLDNGKQHLNYCHVATPQKNPADWRGSLAKEGVLVRRAFDEVGGLSRM